MTFTADANITDEWNENLTRLLIGAEKEKVRFEIFRICNAQSHQNPFKSVSVALQLPNLQGSKKSSRENCIKHQEKKEQKEEEIIFWHFCLFVCLAVLGDKSSATAAFHGCKTVTKQHENPQCIRNFNHTHVDCNSILNVCNGFMVVVPSSNKNKVEK